MIKLLCHLFLGTIYYSSKLWRCVLQRTESVIENSFGTDETSADRGVPQIAEYEDKIRNILFRIIFILCNYCSARVLCFSLYL